MAEQIILIRPAPLTAEQRRALLEELAAATLDYFETEESKKDAVAGFNDTLTDRWSTMKRIQAQLRDPKE